MESTRVFDDYVEVQSVDFNDLQAYAQQSFDDLVHDAVTGSLRYSGFNTTKSNTAEITVAPGRFYGANAVGQVGAVFPITTQTIINLVQYIAVASQRYLTLVVSGTVVLADTQTRDKLINTATNQVEPQEVDMESSRIGILQIVAGSEGPTPQPPPIAVNQVAIANILMDVTGVVSVTMLPSAQVISTEGLDTRLLAVEAFDANITPQVNALATSIAKIMQEINQLGQLSDIVRIYKDLAELKAKEGLPASFSNYGADFFLWPDSAQSDVNNTQSLGFNATIEMGVRFPAQNANEFTLTLFNTQDPNAAFNNGLLLPAYESVLVLETGVFNSAIAIGQFGFQTYALVEQNIAYSRIRDGGSYYQCSNGVTGQTPGDTTVMWWLPNFSTYETSTLTVTDTDPLHYQTVTNYFWHDQWTEPYWSLDTINHTVNGAQIAQSFVLSADTWITQIGIYLQSIASATDINLTLCYVTGGQPDLTKVISHNTITGANLKLGWNVLPIQPTFAENGTRLAVLITSNANHQIGMTVGGSYLNGTFFFTTDGAYFLGDFTKEVMLQVYGASFASNQVTINFGTLNLAGGIRNIDLTARMIIPKSCELIFEVLPDGTGTWLPITPDKPLVPFANAPVLCQFRGRFVGTPSIAPGIQLSDSICKIWCPGPAFTYVSDVETLASATTSLTQVITVENYNPTAHTLTPKIFYAAALHTPATVTTALVDASAGRYTITASYTGLPSTSTFTHVIAGTTNSVSDVFHIAELLWYD